MIDPSSPGAGTGPLPSAVVVTKARRRDQVLVIVFMLILIVPGAALVSGVDPGNYLNRTLASFPPVTVAGVADASYFTAIDGFINDNLPIRPVAIAAKAAFQYRLFGISSNPSVVPGRDGWLFFDKETAPECVETTATVMQQVDELTTSIGGTGRSFHFTIAPDKRSIYPDELPASLQDVQTCTDQERTAMRSSMVQRPGTTVDLWGPVLAARQAAGTMPIYYRQDTHWAARGALAAVRAVVQSIDARVWSDSDIVDVSVPKPHLGDLMRQMGMPDTEVLPRIAVSRPGQWVESVAPADAGPPGRELMHFRAIGPPAVVPGRTLIVGDSFFNQAMSLFEPWFQDLTFVWAPLAACPETLDRLSDFDSVIVEQVERDAYRVDYAGLLAPLIARLTGQPAPYIQSAYTTLCAPRPLSTEAPAFTTSRSPTADGSGCSADTLNQSLFGDVGSSTRREVAIVGWAADLKTRTPPETTYLRLVAANGETYYVVADWDQRPDVATAFGAPALQRAGFETRFSAESASPGDYSVQVVIDTARGPLLCDTGRTLRLTAD